MTLLGQILSLLVFVSLILAVAACAWSAGASSDRTPEVVRLTQAWSNEHFLIATTMLAVGLFAVLSWDSFFPDHRDALVLGPFPIHYRTLLFAKVSAVAVALGIVVASMHSLAGIAWPLALARRAAKPAPALMFDAALPPVRAEDFPRVMGHDIEPLLRDLRKGVPDGKGAIVIGVSVNGVHRIVTYGAAKADSIFEIGSVTKTFTGLLLAQMAVAGHLDLCDPVRSLLPPGTVTAPRQPFEITLLDLATHHSGLPSVPPEISQTDAGAFYTGYRTPDLLQFIRSHGVAKKASTEFEYSNLGFALLGAALSSRSRMSFSDLIQSRIAGPLGMRDTSVQLSNAQRSRFLMGHDAKGRPTPAWDLDAFASAGGLRSTAKDLLEYLDAQLHASKTPFAEAIRRSHTLRGYVAGNTRIALAWIFDPDTGVFEHNGATGGFFAYVCFNPRRDVAATVLVNAYPTAITAAPFLGDHVRQRLDGEPAVSLDSVLIPPAGALRSLTAYWTVVIAAGIFTLCTILAIQGCASWLLPRGFYMRVSALLQLAIFCGLVFGYFTLPSPIAILVSGSHDAWRAMIPTYWFVGLYEQLSGTLHPALLPFARRACAGLCASIVAAAAFYAACYWRGIQHLIEQPDIAPVIRSYVFPGRALLENAIVQFAVRGVLRSSRHRTILSFYLGIGFSFALLYLNAPREIAGPIAYKPWEPLSVPILASTIAVLGASILGVRRVFSLPLDSPARWIFCAAPVCADLACLRAIRRSFYTVSLTPVWLLSATTLLVIWPFRPAAAHLTVLALLGAVLIEVLIGDVQRLPLCCSFYPGRSKLHITFWLCFLGLFVGIMKISEAERALFQNAFSTEALFAVLGISATSLYLWNNHRALAVDAELRFEEEPADAVLSLRLSG